MKKFGLIFDSSCGLTRQEAESKGFGFVPLIININGQQFKAGENISPEDLYSRMNDREVKVSTSTPVAEDIMSEIDKMLETHEQVIFIGMSKKLSGTTNQVRLIAEGEERFKGRVHVADSQYSSPWTKLLIDQFEAVVNAYDTFEEIEAALVEQNDNMIGLLSPGDIWWFYKGGRISKTQYLAGSLLKVIPILTVKDGMIDQSLTEKARTKSKAVVKMIDVFERYVQEKRDQGKTVRFGVLDAGDRGLTDLVISVAKERFGVEASDFVVMPLSAEQTAHMGPNSFGISMYVDFKEFK